MPEQQNEFKGWAKVEVMGHQSHIGYVTTEVYGAAVLFRIDQPALPEETRTLTEREYTEVGSLPAGSIVQEGALPGVSVLVGSGSIYRIIPCSEEAAMKAMRASVRRPLIPLSVPAPQIAAGNAGKPVDAGEPEDFDTDDDDLDDDYDPLGEESRDVRF